MFLASIGNDLDFSFANQASKMFKRKVGWKIQLILTVLKYGYKVLYVDSDVIMLKDPFSLLLSYKGYDIISQRDLQMICTGFFFIVSNNRTIRLMEYAKELIQQHDYDDQTAVNEATNVLNASFLLLPPQAFPSGSDFFRKYQYYWDRKGNTVWHCITYRQFRFHFPQ